MATKSKTAIEFNKDICDVINTHLDQEESINKMKNEIIVLKNIIKNNIKPTTDFKYFKNWMRNEIIEEYRLAGFDDEEIMNPRGYIMNNAMTEILEEFREVEHNKEEIERIKNKDINKELRMIDEIIKSIQ